MVLSWTSEILGQSMMRNNEDWGAVRSNEAKEEVPAVKTSEN